MGKRAKDAFHLEFLSFQVYFANIVDFTVCYSVFLQESKSKKHYRFAPVFLLRGQGYGAEMECLQETIAWLNAALSDYVLTVLLIGCGVFFTIRTRFVQFRCLGEGIRNALGKSENVPHRSGFSPFQSLMATVAAQVGTGNIVGASGAILIGGPGAIFWMWVIASFAMATIYAEAVLAQKTRTVTDGVVEGGPVYYIRKAFPGRLGRFLAGFFAVAIIIALGCVGCMVQVNSISATCLTAFGIPAWATGAALAFFAGLILIGGMARLMRVTEKIAPFMAIFFLLGGLTVLLLRIRYLPATFGCIFKYAFSPEALLGGGFGYAFKTALSQGIKRGLFSNEAGMGSTPHLHALADVSSPHVQGTVAIVGLFIDTFVILTMTALVVISTIYTGDGPLAHATGATYRDMLASSGLTQTNLMQYAISSVSSSVIGNAFVAVCLFFFAFSSVIVWILFGRINCTYLWGKRSASIYSVVAVVLIFCGTLMKSDLVWELQDLLNQLMVLPNVTALIALSGTVASAARRG